MSVAFNGIENLVVTFQAGTVAVGSPAAMSANNTVRNAISGTAPVGIVRNKRNDHAAVQVKGYAEMKYSGSTAPSLGWNSLVADGSGGLRVASTGETGRACLVVSLNTTNKTMGLFL